MKKEKILLMVGSPRKVASTSYSLGNYLLNGLKDHGMSVETIFLLPTVNSIEKRESMFNALDNADLIIMAFPLYVDQLPAPVVKTMELIAKRRQGKVTSSSQRFLAIVNCGFPESFQNRPAEEIVCQFAQQCGFTYLGTLAMGMGEAIHGRPLIEAGGMVRHVVKALDQSIEALTKGIKPPEEVFQLMSKQFIPRWLYIFMGNLGWKRRAGKERVSRQLYARPYESSIST